MKTFLFFRRLRRVAALASTAFASSFAFAGTPGVTIDYDPAAHCYRVDFDLEAVSHCEMGRQYAAAIRREFPKFERLTDRFLKETIDAANKGIDDPAKKMTLAKVLANVNELRMNIPPEYMEEIEGMGLVFSWPKDELGDGHLSPQEIFVSVIFEDVTESAACSAAAVFGGASSTGKTIVGRNNDWAPDEETDSWNAFFVFHNGDKSSAGNGMIGELFPNNVFNRHHIFGASLDSYPASEPPPRLAGSRSPTVDLRYAIESSRTLAEAEEFLRGHSYATGSLTLLADAKAAHVLEYDTSRPVGRRGTIRSDGSKLIKGVGWGIPNAIASVNSFVLPGGFPNHLGDAHNRLRFKNFRNLLRDDLKKGPVDLDGMKATMGYTSRDGCSTTTGAIFRLGVESGGEKDNATFQSLVMRLDTFETWMAYSARGSKWPYQPAYYKILGGSPFK
ncbi:MAG: C45 family autoproteolytic acyltransferase/hydrolase [Verrucomicrobiae bacterium]